MRGFIFIYFTACILSVLFFQFPTIDKTKDTTGLMIHSDQGILYQANQFRKLLKSYNIEQSMSLLWKVSLLL